MTVSEERPSVLVIGAQGALGSLVAAAFHGNGWLVRPAGRRADLPPGWCRVDLADPSTLGPALEGMDLVVTTVADPTLAAERAVLDRGGCLLNLSAGPAAGLHTLRRHSSTPRGVVMMHGGVAPGLSNLVAADLLREHPDADEVQMVFTVSARGSGGAASGDFAHRGLTGLRHHRVTRVELPPPYGSRRVLGFAEADRGWLGPTADQVVVSPYICLAERPLGAAMLALNGARLISRLPRRALGDGRRTTVEDASREPVAHSVSVLRRGRVLGWRLIRGWGDFRMAAQSAVVLARALLDPAHASVRPGAWSAEELLTLDQVEEALRDGGCDGTARVDIVRGGPAGAAGRST